jgi:hypothetical protein
MESKGRYLKNLPKVHATNIIKPMQTCINREICVTKLLEHLKIKKMTVSPISAYN